MAPRAFQDIGRLTDFLLASLPETAVQTGDLLIDGLSILKNHPLIGRTVEHGYRELLISRGRTGYVALYSFDVEKDVVTVLAIHHQRENG